MTAFRGKRVQRGRGVAFSFLKRIAVPLLTAAAPHIVGAASSLARRLTAKAFPKQKGMQRIVGNVVRAGAGAAVASAQKRAAKRKLQTPKSGSTTTTTTTKKRKSAVNEASRKRKIGIGVITSKGTRRRRRNIFDE
jgi:hypothetical protein